MRKILAVRGPDEIRAEKNFSVSGKRSELNQEYALRKQPLKVIWL
jgi:hypothetical protein